MAKFFEIFEHKNIEANFEPKILNNKKIFKTILPKKFEAPSFFIGSYKKSVYKNLPSNSLMLLGRDHFLSLYRFIFKILNLVNLMA